MFKKRILYKDLVGYDKNIFDLDRASYSVGVPSSVFNSIIDGECNDLNNKNTRFYFSILKKLIRETKCEKNNFILSFFDRFLFATDYCDTCFDRNGFEASCLFDDFVYKSTFSVEDGYISSSVSFGDDIISDICFSKNSDGMRITLNDSRTNALKLVDADGINRLNLSEEFHYLDYDNNFGQIARGDIFSKKCFSKNSDGSCDKVYSKSKEATYFWREDNFILKKYSSSETGDSYFIGKDDFEREIDVNAFFYPVDKRHVDLFLNKEIDAQELWNLTKEFVRKI